MTEISNSVKTKVGNTAQKGKAGFFRIVFSRTGVILLLLILQIYILITAILKLNDYLVYFYSVFTVISVCLIIAILNKKTNPIYVNLWIIIVLIIPVFGALLYLFVNLNLGSRFMNKKLMALINETAPYLQQDPGVKRELEIINPSMASLGVYMEEYGKFSIYKNTSAKYFASGSQKLDSLLEELEKAEKFIFLEYFIIKDGYMWSKVLEILERKASDGVEVRLMYDGMFALLDLPHDFSKKIQAKNINCKSFAPIYPALSSHQNNRDHRKIVVIDGHTAYTGGINIGDEYINKEERFGYWKDTAIMLKGDAVRSFTLMFLQIWNISVTQPEDYFKYINIKQDRQPDNVGYVMGYSDSPLDNENVGEQVYINILNHAHRYVHIMTPYLILSYEMQQTLEFTAKRGVEVIILMPHIPDKKTAFLVAKTYYKDLITAGVKIYEFTPGFVHAKVFVSDDHTAVVGTINLDFRSLYLHFECAAYIYKNPEVLRIEEDYQKTLEVSQEITLEDCENQSPAAMLAGRVLKIFAPLM